MKYKIFSIIIFFSLLLTVKPIFGQSYSFGITPPILEAMVMPGKSITQVFKLINFGSTQQVYVQAIAFTPKDELGNINLDLTNKGHSPEYLNWFTLMNADLSLPGGFLLETGKTQELVLKITVPETAQEKDYYVSLVFTVNPQDNLVSRSGTQTAGIISSNILLTVSKTGQPTLQAEIKEFSVPNISILGFKIALFDSFDPVPFTLKVANTGKTVFKTVGSIKIFNSFNKEVKFLELAPQNVLAFSSRQIQLLGPNDSQPTQPIIWTCSPFNIGRYKATAYFTPGNDNKLQQDVFFWIFPWKISIGIILFITILIFIKLLFKKR